MGLLKSLTFHVVFITMISVSGRLSNAWAGLIHGEQKLIGSDLIYAMGTQTNVGGTWKKHKLNGLGLFNEEFVSTTTSPSANIIRTTLELLLAGDLIVQKANQSDIILVVGMTGSGKSTLVQLLTGDNSKLISVKKHGEYVIVDEGGRIGNKTSISKTEFPELFIQNETQNAYYDCPGFQDTRNSSVEISNAFFIKRVAGWGERVKIIVLVNRESLRPDSGRSDFPDLLKQLAILINSPIKIRDGIGLIVSKVRDTDNDEEVTKDIAGVMKDILDERKEDPMFPAYKELIDSFTQQNQANNKYTRIGLFRAPPRNGTLSEIPEVQANKHQLLKMILEETQFIRTSSQDFGFALSSEAMGTVRELSHLIAQSMLEQIQYLTDYLSKRLIQNLDELILNSVDTSPTLDLTRIRTVLTHVEEMKHFHFESGNETGRGLNMTAVTASIIQELSETCVTKSTTDCIHTSNIQAMINYGNYLTFLQQFSPTSDPFLEQQIGQWVLNLHQFSSEVSYYIHSNFYSEIESKFLNSAKTLVFECIENLKKTFDVVHDIIDLQIIRKKQLGQIDQVIEQLKKCTQEDSVDSGMLKLGRMFIRLFRTLDFLEISATTIQKMLKQVEVLELTKVDGPGQFRLDGLVETINPISKLIQSEIDWWGFLQNLFEDLSKREIQIQDQFGLKSWANGEGKSLRFSVINFTEFWKIFRKLPAVYSLDFEKINETIGITSDIKMRSLNKLIDFTLREQQHIERISDNSVLRISGSFLTLSQTLPNMTALTKTLVLAALHTVFVDVNISNPGFNIVMIAPKWEIVNERRIDLDGSQSPPPIPPKVQHENPVNIPSLPGGNGGHFYGIGSTFIGGVLTISASGGQGGRGQDGMDGPPGKDGDDLDWKKTKCVGRTFRWDGSCEGEPYLEYPGPYGITRIWVHPCETSIWNAKMICGLWLAYGEPGKVGENGGNGGAGGFGGNRGTSVFSYLVKDELSLSRIDLLNCEDGRNGINGTGGAGGKGGLSGRGQELQVVQNPDDGHGNLICNRCHVDPHDFQSGHYAEDGKSGVTGGYTNRIPAAGDNFKITTYSDLVNQYKADARSSLQTNEFMRHSLFEFLGEMDTDSSVQNTYDAVGLFNDLISLEIQFSKFRGSYNSKSSKSEDNNSRNTFITYYESLLRRIQNKVKNLPKENSSDDRISLTYLYTVGLSRLCTLKSALNTFLVINIRDYLQILDKHVKSLREKRTTLNRLTVIQNRKDQFNEEINSKIADARYLITTVLEPEILKVEAQISLGTDAILIELQALKKQAYANLTLIRETEKKLKTSMVLDHVFGIFKVSASALSLLGPLGVATGTLISEGLDMGQSFLSPSNGSPKLPSIPDSIKQWQETSMAEFEKSANKSCSSFLIQLNRITAMLMNQSKYFPDDNSVENIISTIKKTIVVIESDVQSRGARVHQPPLYPYTLNITTDTNILLTTLKNELKSALKYYNETLTIKMNEVKFDHKTVIKALNDLGHIMDILNLEAKTYEKLKDDQWKLDLVIEQEKQIEEEIQEIKQQEERVNDILRPVLNNMMDNMADFQRKISTDSGAALEIDKWKISTTLRDIQLMVHTQFTSGLGIDVNMERCFEKLTEAFTVLINIYDRLQHYGEQAKLADFTGAIAESSISQMNITNPKLRKAYLNLDIVFESSLIVNQYDSAMASFLMYVYPFSNLYLDKFELPSEFDAGINNDSSVTDVGAQVSSKIETLLDDINLYNAGLDLRIHPYIHTKEFESLDPPGSDSFYIWRCSEYQSDIIRLLSGHRVLLKSNPLQTIDAVKFNRIELSFRIDGNKALEKLLANELVTNFGVVMNHTGNSAYRFNNRVTVITHSKLVLNYTFEKKADGKPTDMTYEDGKLADGDLLLSPYTMWEIQLFGRINLETGKPNAGFDNLTRIVGSHCVHLELIGSGIYVSNLGWNGGFPLVKHSNITDSAKISFSIHQVNMTNAEVK